MPRRTVCTSPTTTRSTCLIFTLMIMKSLTSRDYVTEVFNWQWFYWTLTDAGIEYLREQLFLPRTAEPATLTKETRNTREGEYGEGKGEKGEGKGEDGKGKGKKGKKGKGKGKGWSSKGYGGYESWDAEKPAESGEAAAEAVAEAPVYTGEEKTEVVEE